MIVTISMIDTAVLKSVVIFRLNIRSISTMINIITMALNMDAAKEKNLRTKNETPGLEYVSQ